MGAVQVRRWRETGRAREPAGRRAVSGLHCCGLTHLPAALPLARGSRHWEGNTFVPGNVLASKTPVPEAVLVQLDADTGAVGAGGSKEAPRPCCCRVGAECRLVCGMAASCGAGPQDPCPQRVWAASHADCGPGRQPVGGGRWAAPGGYWGHGARMNAFNESEGL